jgi:hypothetical protein
MERNEPDEDGYVGAATLWNAMVKNNVARAQFNKALAAWRAIFICPNCNNFGYRASKKPWPAPRMIPCHCEHGQGKPPYEKFIDDDIPF